MDPGVLVPNISHLKQIFVKACTLHSILKERLMCTWCTCCNHDTIDAILYDRFLDPVLCILRAGKHALFAIHYKRKLPCILYQLRNLHYAADVYAAIAYINADPRRLPSNIPQLRGNRLYCKGIM